MSIVIVANSREERGPLESVIAALPEARVVGFDSAGMTPREAMSTGLLAFTGHYEDIKPSIAILLGDRYETLAAALAALFLRVPIAHIHGGETTAGAFDDALRHSITHMADLHFVATEDAGRKVADLGACQTRITCVGAPGLDGVAGDSATRADKLAVVTYHPETRAPDYGVARCQAMLAALTPTLLGYEIVFCGVNNDPGATRINELIREHVRTHGGTVVTNMSHAAYIQALQRAAVVIGNSSASLIEAPWVGVPTVLVGDRQLGRPCAPSVFQDDADIGAAIRDALVWRGPWEPCYKGDGVGEKIAKVVREYVARLASRGDCSVG